MDARVVDLSHHNSVSDFGAVAASGVWGIIHKATQGRAYADPDYASQRALATKAELLWGAYHFNTGDDVKSQVDYFMSKADPDEKTLMVLDYEDNRLSNMNVHQVLDFLHQIEAKLGRKAALYSGNRIKETISQLSPADRAYLVSHRLWLCQYGPTARLPMGFSKWWLWQFTDGQVGPKPHVISGISGLTDINTYSGTQEQLASEWK